ncbi:MAG: hypothetical protein MZV70_45360 [Desulfobacterales bacterium]|nr:hypothetical protein [Desulfobacterales bacterium]
MSRPRISCTLGPGGRGCCGERGLEIHRDGLPGVHRRGPSYTRAGAPPPASARAGGGGSAATRRARLVARHQVPVPTGSALPPSLDEPPQPPESPSAAATGGAPRVRPCSGRHGERKAEKAVRQNAFEIESFLGYLHRVHSTLAAGRRPASQEMPRGSVDAAVGSADGAGPLTNPAAP